MPPTAVAQALALTTANPSELDTDLLVVPVFEGEAAAGELEELDRATSGALGRAIASREVQGRPFELFVTPLVTGWRAERIAFAGAGKRADFSTERLRRLATAAALSGRQRRVSRLTWMHRGDLDLAASVQATAEGLVLAAFSGDRYKTGERMGAPASQLAIAVNHGAAQPMLASLEAAVEQGTNPGRVQQHFARPL